MSPTCLVPYCFVEALFHFVFNSELGGPDLAILLDYASKRRLIEC